MPNIIEQQDLLKGLPDARLALLMQKPDASIPPFLVAAEAQRRQAIRQQFSGDGSKESVVDTLAKQLANVPQNIQAPMQTPPNIPQPQMGIAALQQPQQPQQMAAGGPVRRFANGTLVTPSFRGRAGAGGYPTPSDNWGILGDVYDAATAGFGTLTENMQKFGVNPTQEQIRALKEKSASEVEIPTDTYVDPFVKAGRPAQYAKPPVKPRDPTASTANTSNENKEAAKTSEYRDRLEALFANEEPSNWEEAQKWFAMASQIMNPDANLMQGLVNAGAVYAEAEGAQARAEREGDIELQKALLQYDIGERDYERQSAAQAQANKLEAMKYLGGESLKMAEMYRKAADDATDALNRQIAAISANSLGATPEQIANDPTVKALQERVDKANEALRNATIRAQGFGTMFGNTYGLPAGFEASDGDTFFNTGG